MEKGNILSFKNFEIKPFYIFLLLCIGFVLFKIPHLSLPYYWDEAWVYGKAARTMADEGLSLAPNSLHFELGRGHPLLFHFLFAAFLKIAGNTVFSSHLFALIISVLVLFLVFSLSEKHIGKSAGIFTTASLMLQPIFLAQSCLVLPEMTLTLFILLSLKFYFEEKKILFWICAAAGMLIKESAIVVYASISLFEVLNFFIRRDKTFGKLLLQLLLINSAIFPWLIFLLVQKKQLGFYFFQEHTGYISFAPADMWDKFYRGVFFTFIAQGRNIISFLFLASLAFCFYRKKKNLGATNESKDPKSVPLIKGSWLFILVFLLFTCVNYFSNRYVLCIVTLFTFVAFYTILSAAKNKIVRLLVLLSAISAGIYNNLSYESNSDHNLGYVNAVNVFSESVDFIKKDLKKNDTIYAYFIMREALIKPYSGYINKNEVFTNIEAHLPGTFRYYIFSNVENEEEKKFIADKKDIVLYKRFQKKQAWVEIWKKNN